MSTKKTHKDLFAELLALAETDEQREFINGRMEMLDKKNGTRKPSATQIENEDTKSAILSAMEIGKTYTVTDIMKMLGLESNQKASALVRQLKNDKLVERTEIKGRAYFSKVEG